MEVNGIRAEVVRKHIKNLYVRVYPPDGLVRVTAPFRLRDEAIHSAIAARSKWIRKNREKLRKQAPQSEPELVTGDILHFQGRCYRLVVEEFPGRPTACILDNTAIGLRVRPGAGRDKREAMLQQWYRLQLKERIPDLISRWEPVIGVKVAGWGIKKMKRLWGSCNVNHRRVWVNLELAKKPPECLEYILVHEMTHLLERRHNKRFQELMDRFMPQWRVHRDVLNRTPSSDPVDPGRQGCLEEGTAETSQRNPGIPSG